MVYETKKDCPPVESLIWDKVCASYGDFEGVKKLTFSDLLEFQSACTHQLQLIVSKNRQGKDHG